MEIRRWQLSRSIYWQLTEWRFLNISMFQTRFERILIYLSDGVIIRDKVEDFGHFDDKTLFVNESPLHTKIAFTRNISHFNHSLRLAVSLSAVRWSFGSQRVNEAKSWNMTAKIAEINAWPFWWVFECDQFEVVTALPRVETWPFNTLRVEGTKFVMLQIMFHTKTPLRYQIQENLIKSVFIVAQ